MVSICLCVISVVQFFLSLLHIHIVSILFVYNYDGRLCVTWKDKKTTNNLSKMRERKKVNKTTNIRTQSIIYWSFELEWTEIAPDCVGILVECCKFSFCASLLVEWCTWIQKKSLFVLMMRPVEPLMSTD